MGNAGLIFRASKPDIGADAYCGYYVGINAGQSELEFGWVSNSWHVVTNVPTVFSANTTCHLAVHAQGPRLQVFVNGNPQPSMDIQDSHFASGMVGVRNYCTDSDRSFSSFSKLKAREVPKL